MAHPKKVKKLQRILQLIKRLYTLETIRPSHDAKEYGVDPKTITRNLQEIATVIPLMNKRGVWSLDLKALTMNKNSLDLSLLQSFANTLHLDLSCFDLYAISQDTVKFAIEYKNLPKELGEAIIEAMQKRRSCSFNYVKTNERSNRFVDPIRLFTQQGEWYLIAHDHKDGRVKSFLLAKIEHFQVGKEEFTLPAAIEQEASNFNNVWRSSNAEEIKVKLYINAFAANYIKESKLHPTQEIVDEHYTGEIEVECTITHKLELLPAIKSWLPNIQILKPKWLREELIKDCKDFLKEAEEIDKYLS